MSFSDKYFSRYQSFPNYIRERPNNDLNIIIVIPCFNEPDLISSLKSLDDCTPPNTSVEVITIINASEKSAPEIIEQNKTTYLEAANAVKGFNNPKVKYFFIQENSLIAKFAGVGLARKIGMDEAVRRFSLVNNPKGIIVGFDADAKVEPNYLVEIEKHFAENPKTSACSINFEHPVTRCQHGRAVENNNIIEYELHLRYFIEALRYAGFPYAYQTIGSSFAVRADTYVKQGGMNRKKAGEDFYFLQKIIPLGNYTELNTTKVIPSPRMSDRVPFGTGKTMSDMEMNFQKEYYTYSFDAFEDLKYLFDNKNMFFQNKTPYNNTIPESIEFFLRNTGFANDLKKINKNSPNLKIFEKRFFDWFNAFRVVKYLNFIHLEHYKKMIASQATICLLRKKNIDTTNLYKSKDLLIFLRNNEIFKL